MTTGADETLAAAFPAPGPCPGWCELSAGHGWEDVTFDEVADPPTIGRWHRAFRSAWLVDQLEVVNTAGYLVREAAAASSGRNGQLSLAEMLGADEALELLLVLPTTASDVS